MIIIDLCKTMREVDDTYDYDSIIRNACETITTKFYKPEKGLLLESVGPDGEYFKDVPEGRCVNPGHAIESAWFIIEESIQKGYGDLLGKALEILLNSLRAGWDEKEGGIFYFIDSEGMPPYALEWDQKLWWPHNEALYALLLAGRITGDGKYSEWYEKVHEWAFDRFFDSEYGEWYGYLHRDGSLLTPFKGGIWKGAFHVPRFYMKGIELLSGGVKRQ
jgi:N-acylglucosamine 2-epimerase